MASPTTPLAADLRRVLVTGGAGYIGSHACKRLARAGHHVVAFDNLSAGHREAVKFGHLVEGDITVQTERTHNARYGRRTTRTARRVA